MKEHDVRASCSKKEEKNKEKLKEIRDQSNVIVCNMIMSLSLLYT